MSQEAHVCRQPARWTNGKPAKALNWTGHLMLQTPHMQIPEPEAAAMLLDF